MKQLTLFKQTEIGFGRSLLNKKRRSKRPLSSRSLIHVVLKADISQSKSLLRNRKTIHEELEKWSERFGIQVYCLAVWGNHIHLAILIPSGEAYKSFIRIFTGRLAQLLKVKWLSRPYTRLVKWGRDFENLKSYIQRNHEEAIALRPYKLRERHL